MSDRPLQIGERWFVGYTLPRKETMALEHLRRQGFGAFTPRILTSRRHARRVERVKEPLFPGYVFIRLDLKRDKWRSVNGTVGMAYLLSAMETPSPVPAGFVESLQRIAGTDDVVAREPDLAPGDPVRIVAGPLAGQIGELLRLDAKGRVEVLLGLLAGKVRLKMARNMLERAA